MLDSALLKISERAFEPAIAKSWSPTTTSRRWIAPPDLSFAARKSSFCFSHCQALPPKMPALQIRWLNALRLRSKVCSFIADFRLRHGYVSDVTRGQNRE